MLNGLSGQRMFVNHFVPIRELSGAELFPLV